MIPDDAISGMAIFSTVNTCPSSPEENAVATVVFNAYKFIGTSRNPTWNLYGASCLFCYRIKTGYFDYL